MRVAVAEPCAVGPEMQREYGRAAAFEGFLTEQVYQGVPYLPLNAILLTPHEQHALAYLSERFAHVFAIAASTVSSEPAILVDLGFPPGVAELVAQEPPTPVLFGRFDWLVDASGTWRLLEYNADCPMGLREAIVADRLAHRLLGTAAKRLNNSLSARLVMAILSRLDARRAAANLGLLGDAQDPETLGQLAFVRHLLDQEKVAGLRIVLGDIRNLSIREQRVTLRTVPLDALYRMYAWDALYEQRGQFHALTQAAVSGQVLLLNGLYGLVLENKGLMAWIWAHRKDSLFSASDQQLIERHLPATWMVRQAPELAPETVVVKHVFGRQGRHVALGTDVSAEAWTSCRELGAFVVQGHVSSVPQEATILRWDGQPVVAQCSLVLGSFVVEEKWAGCFARGGSTITGPDAVFLPTFREARPRPPATPQALSHEL